MNKGFVGVMVASLSLLAPGFALAQSVDAFNPGIASSPPGTGCEIGTSGCYPSSPPGPVTEPADPGGTTENPPPLVNPQDVPFYGTLPGPSAELPSPQATPEYAKAYREEEARAREVRMQQLLEQQTQELAQQRQQLESQTEELAQQREQIQTLQDQLQQQQQQKEGEEGAQGQGEAPTSGAPAAPAPSESGR